MSEISPDWTIAELDEHLGRWRWPEHPQFTVVEKREILWVTNEESVTVRSVPKNVAPQNERFGPTSHQAAYAFLEAHGSTPEWHRARAGEIWAIRTDKECRYFNAYFAVDHGIDGLVLFVPVDRTNPTLDDIDSESPEIVSAHRIWSGDGLAE